jgi:hypothetical protein
MYIRLRSTNEDFTHGQLSPRARCSDGSGGGGASVLRRPRDPEECSAAASRYTQPMVACALAHTNTTGSRNRTHSHGKRLQSLHTCSLKHSTSSYVHSRSLTRLLCHALGSRLVFSGEATACVLAGAVSVQGHTLRSG